MTETHERWFMTEDAQLAAYIKPSSHEQVSVDYRYIGDGMIMIQKREIAKGMRRATKYFSEGWGEKTQLKGEDVKAAKSRLSEKSQVVKVLCRNGTFRNRENILVKIFFYSGPTGKVYHIYRILFESEQDARDFKPTISLGLEITGNEGWSGYPLWQKLTT